MSPSELQAQAIEILIEVRRILVSAYGGNLDGSERGPLVSSHYLASIRDLFKGYTPERPAAPCASCIELRGRLLNVYHLTINYRDAPSTLLAVREATRPGAPAPASSDLDVELIDHGPWSPKRAGAPPAPPARDEEMRRECPLDFPCQAEGSGGRHKIVSVHGTDQCIRCMRTQASDPPLPPPFGGADE